MVRTDDLEKIGIAGLLLSAAEIRAVEPSMEHQLRNRGEAQWDRAGTRDPVERGTGSQSFVEGANSAKRIQPYQHRRK